MIETLAGEDHPDWYVLGTKHDAKLISMCEMLPRVLADDTHFRPDDLEAWRVAFSRESWPRGISGRPTRALDCLADGRYWLVIHEPPRWGPMVPPS